MSDVIKFRCKSCEKKIGVRAAYAGKKIRCPGCKEPMRVPSPRSKRTATGSPIAAGSSSSSAGQSAAGISLAELAALEDQAHVEIKELSTKAGNRSGGPRIEGGKDCPGCGASTNPNAVICVHCGHNFESGKQLKTKKDTKLGKAMSSMKGATASAGEGAVSSVGEWSWWSVGVGGVLSVLGVAMAFYNFRPESDPTADEAHIFEIILLFMYDTMGPMVSGGITLFVGLALLTFGFRLFR